MKSLGTWAAIAVATAFAQDIACAVPHQPKTLGRAQRSETVTNVTKPNSDSQNKHCTDQINAWRTAIDSNLPQYQANSEGVATTDISSFVGTGCDVVASGTYTHLLDGALVISATKPAASRSEITCEEALDIWEQGFEVFAGEYPAAYKENDGAYNNPNAVALVSLLSDQALQIFCGNPTGCTDLNNTLVCYLKPPGITADEHPVTLQLWHKVEEHFQLKPKLVAHDAQHQQCLDAVNAVRGADGLGLADYTGPSVPGKRFKRSSLAEAQAYERALYDLTCDELENATVDPAAAEGYTIIYHVKEGDTPGPVEAVNFWKTGYDKLGTSLPPVFIPKSDETELRKRDEEEVDYSALYYDSAVAGYVSIMADGAREMRCYNATGCTKNALVCVLNDATLKEDEHPISEETWRKILKTKGINKPALTRRNSTESCLEEINAVRTHDGLALKPFTAESTEQRTTARSDLLDNVTCDAIEAADVVVTDSNNQSSLIYHHGEEGTCAEAVEAWKQGYEQFSEVEIPPVYNSTAQVYKREGATNFVSIMTPKDNVTIACYTAEGCSKNAIVCELKPPALEDGKQPFTSSAWQNVTDYMASNSAASLSSTMALLSSAILAAAAVALQF